MPLDVSHLPASLHPYLWGGTAAMVAEASTFPIGELTEWTTSLTPKVSLSGQKLNLAPSDGAPTVSSVSYPNSCILYCLFPTN